MNERFAIPIADPKRGWTIPTTCPTSWPKSILTKNIVPHYDSRVVFSGSVDVSADVSMTTTNPLLLAEIHTSKEQIIALGN